MRGYGFVTNVGKNGTGTAHLKLEVWERQQLWIRDQDLGTEQNVWCASISTMRLNRRDFGIRFNKSLVAANMTFNPTGAVINFKNLSRFSPWSFFLRLWSLSVWLICYTQMIFLTSHWTRFIALIKYSLWRHLRWLNVLIFRFGNWQRKTS